MLLKYYHFLLLAFCSFVIVSCDFNRTEMLLTSADSVIEDNPDSAKALLDRLALVKLHSPKDSAYYGSLYCQAQYELYNNPDTSLLSYSADYYGMTKDKVRLQRCCYYMAMIIFDDAKENKKVISRLKQAENLIPDVRDTLMTLKIYDALASWNTYFMIKDQSLMYAGKVLQLS